MHTGDPESINNHRLSLLLQNPATSPTNHGSIIIDDSACKKWGQHFQSVAPQYYSPEKIITNCNVVVFSAYADSKNLIPLTLNLISLIMINSSLPTNILSNPN